MKSLNIPRQDPRLTKYDYLVPWNEQEKHVPQNPERTCFRASKDGIRYVEYPTRDAMLRACGHQPKGITGSNQWKPFKEKNNAG